MKTVKLLVLIFCLVALAGFSFNCKEQPPEPPVVTPPTEPPTTQGLTCEEAIEKVMALNEVADYFTRVPQAKVKCDSQEDDGTWLMQVYEIVEDAGVPHTATFDWYYVYSDGTIQSSFPFEDVVE